MANLLNNLFSAIKRGKSAKEVVEDALSRDGKRRKVLKIIRNVLIIIAVLAALVAGVLGYLGILPIYADNGLTPIKGTEGAFCVVIFAEVGILLFLVAPVVAVIGVVQAVRFTLLGVAETLDTSISESAPRLLKTPVRRIIARLVVRWLPYMLISFGIAAHFIAPTTQAIISQATGLGVGLVFNLFWKNKKRPYIAYLQAVIDVGYAGYDGSFSFIRNVITAIQPTWISGELGIFFAVASFVLLTGFWSIFSNRKQ